MSALDAVDEYDWQGFGDELAAEAMPYLEELVRSAMTDTGRILPIGVSFNQRNPKVDDAVGQLAQQIRGVSETVRENVRRIVAQGLREGRPTREIAAALAEYGVTDSASRAQTIARTETAQAYSAGAVAAYQEAGVTKKKWLASPNSCPECEATDGEIVGMDSQFSNGVDHPPLHPRCTCSVAPYID